MNGRGLATGTKGTRALLESCAHTDHLDLAGFALGGVAIKDFIGCSPVHEGKAGHQRRPREIVEKQIQRRTGRDLSGQFLHDACSRSATALHANEPLQVHPGGRAAQGSSGAVWLDDGLDRILHEHHGRRAI